MKRECASQVATLLNERNQLTALYTPEKVLQQASGYLLRTDTSNEVVVGCIEVKKVQWYQAEILHLTVAKNHEGRGLARSLLSEALVVASKAGARLAQCTIRMDNEDSIRVFEAAGFVRTAVFKNERSGNNVGVWQLVVSAES